MKWREASFKTKKMSPKLGFDRFGGHLVQTLPQTERKKIISKYFGKRCTSISTLRISISFLGCFFFARSTEPGPGLRSFYSV